jgi:hypothetical protein
MCFSILNGSGDDDIYISASLRTSAEDIASVVGVMQVNKVSGHVDGWDDERDSRLAIQL